VDGMRVFSDLVMFVVDVSGFFEFCLLLRPFFEPRFKFGLLEVDLLWPLMADLLLRFIVSMEGGGGYWERIWGEINTK